MDLLPKIMCSNFKHRISLIRCGAFADSNHDSPPIAIGCAPPLTIRKCSLKGERERNYGQWEWHQK